MQSNMNIFKIFARELNKKYQNLRNSKIDWTVLSDIAFDWNS